MTHFLKTMKKLPCYLRKISRSSLLASISTIISISFRYFNNNLIQTETGPTCRTWRVGWVTVWVRKPSAGLRSWACRRKLIPGAVAWLGIPRLAEGSSRAETELYLVKSNVADFTNWSSICTRHYCRDEQPASWDNNEGQTWLDNAELLIHMTLLLNQSIWKKINFLILRSKDMYLQGTAVTEKKLKFYIMTAKHAVRMLPNSYTQIQGQV